VRDERPWVGDAPQAAWYQFSPDRKGANGYTLYFSGSTDLTLDMKLWGELFKPDAAILYLSSKMDPRDVALPAQFLSEKNPNLKTVIPSHHRLKQTAGRTPADLGESLTALGVKAKLLDPQLGKVYTLSK